MKRIISLSFTIIITGLMSCLDEPVQKIDSIYKPDILNYLNELKPNTDEDARSQRIENLIHDLDFKNVAVHKIRGGEDLLIADIKNLSDFEEKGTLKALFFINQSR